MSRTIRRASVLAATMAALGLVIAAPASASSVGAQATIGTAFELEDFNGDEGSLDSLSVTCTDIPDIDSALSGENESSTDTIRFYADALCLNLVDVLQPMESDSDFGTAAVSYRVIPGV